ncbi:MAG: hypothetical protein M0C28_07565 [Candidatus Moduliflexus flocculans]|nr:hypothetical protein [Candidatus Moduliflexus flocculans]
MFAALRRACSGGPAENAASKEIRDMEVDHATRSVKTRLKGQVSGPTSKASHRPRRHRLFVDVDTGQRPRHLATMLIDAGRPVPGRHRLRQDRPRTARSGSSTPSPSTRTTSRSCVRTSAPADRPDVRFHHARHPQRRLVRARVSWTCWA